MTQGLGIPNLEDEASCLCSPLSLVTHFVSVLSTIIPHLHTSFNCGMGALGIGDKPLSAIEITRLGVQNIV